MANHVSETQFAEALAERLQVSKGDARWVIRQFKEEMTEALTHGNKVTLTNFASFTPTVKKGRKKGTEVRNPFDGSVKVLKADEPDKTLVKAKVAKAVLDAMPNPR